MYPLARTNPRRVGAVAPMVMLILVSLLVFTALAVDIGHIQVAHGQMQRAVDATALAGASGLPDGEDIATSRATTYAGLNNIDGASLAIHGVTITVGNWENTTAAFYPLDGTETIAPNAVRVVGRYPDLPLVFAPVIGINEANVAKTAIASGGSGGCAGVWAFETLGGNGNIITDSYDSRVGPYGGDNIYSNGDLCSCQDMDLVGSAEIHGDAMYGEGYELDTAGGALEIWGISAPYGCNTPAPVFDIDEAEATNDNDSIGLTDDGRNPFLGATLNLRLTGTDNLTLAPGTYFFTSVTLAGMSTLTIVGPTNIYISGDANLTGGGVINGTGDPGNLTIYSTGVHLTLRGESGFWGSVIAPDTRIDVLGTPDFYGILMGLTVDISGDTNIHVDEAMVDELLDLRSTTVALVR